MAILLALCEIHFRDFGDNPVRLSSKILKKYLNLPIPQISRPRTFGESRPRPRGTGEKQKSVRHTKVATGQTWKPLGARVGASGVDLCAQLAYTCAHTRSLSFLILLASLKSVYTQSVQ